MIGSDPDVLASLGVAAPSLTVFKKGLFEVCLFLNAASTPAYGNVFALSVFESFESSKINKALYWEFFC